LIRYEWTGETNPLFNMGNKSNRGRLMFLDLHRVLLLFLIPLRLGTLARMSTQTLLIQLHSSPSFRLIPNGLRHDHSRGHSRDHKHLQVPMPRAVTWSAVLRLRPLPLCRYHQFKGGDLLSLNTRNLNTRSLSTRDLCCNDTQRKSAGPLQRRNQFHL